MFSAALFLNPSRETAMYQRKDHHLLNSLAKEYTDDIQHELSTAYGMDNDAVVELVRRIWKNLHKGMKR